MFFFWTLQIFLFIVLSPFILENIWKYILHTIRLVLVYADAFSVTCCMFKGACWEHPDYNIAEIISYRCYCLKESTRFLLLWDFYFQENTSWLKLWTLANIW